MKPSTVRPRVQKSIGGEALRLEDAMAGWTREGARGTVRLGGPAGMGKATTLAYWGRQGKSGCLVLHEPDPEELRLASTRGLVLYTSQDAEIEPTLGGLDMAPWGADEVLEYLLASHQEQVADVLMRLRGSSLSDLTSGCPELIVAVLDRMAADTALVDPKQALRGFLYGLEPGPDCARYMGSFSLGFWDHASDKQVEAGLVSAPFQEGGRMPKLLGFKIVRTLLAADRVRTAIDEGDWMTMHLLEDRWALVREVAALLDRNLDSQAALRQGLNDPSMQGLRVPVSILHATQAGWTPEDGEPLTLTGALLVGAQWANLHLDDSNLRSVDLRGANLRGVHFARLKGHFSCFDGADLTGAKMHEAHFWRAHFRGAVLDGADLSHATLRAPAMTGLQARGANFQGTQFIGGTLRGACLAGSDLSSANLAGLNLRETDLEGCNLSTAVLEGCSLQHKQMRGAKLPSANLRRCDLTGAQFSGAMLWGADLECAALADVNFAGANLRNVNFEGVAFQRGSTREGLLVGKPPLWGSITGFYSGDSSGLDSHAPEEIRTANFCRADLRGAEVHGADWYLVDLRAALYDSEQALHFEGCGAILR